MNDKERNKSKADQVLTTQDDLADMQSVGKGRRWFIKKVIVAAPVILTVASRPVWARNCTLSGQLSGNLSDEGECGGEGCPPDSWKNNTQKWHPEFQPDCSFHDVFEVDPWGTNPSLYDVIVGLTHLEPLVNVLGFHAVAALQNSATEVSFDLTVEDVIDMVAGAYILWGQTGDKSHLEVVKTYLDDLNNKGCPW